MSSNFELVIFDWDGTLMDSLSRIVASMRHAAADVGLPLLDESQIHDIIGLELGLAILALYPQLTLAEVDIVRQRYSHHYVLLDQQACNLYPDVEKMLATLSDQGRTLSIATGKSRKGLDRVLESVGLAHLFDGTRCADETDSKPHPAMVNELLNYHSIDPERVVVVGDTEFDMEMARNANVNRIAVSWGAHNIERLHQYEPIACVDTVEQLTRTIVGS